MTAHLISIVSYYLAERKNDLKMLKKCVKRSSKKLAKVTQIYYIICWGIYFFATQYFWTNANNELCFKEFNLVYFCHWFLTLLVTFLSASFMFLLVICSPCIYCSKKMKNKVRASIEE